MQARARELLPQVLLTLQSIVQALALELLWDRVANAPHLLPPGGVEGVAFAGLLAGWLQVGGIVLGIVLIWLVYVGLVLRFAWVPRTRDSLFPFAIGLLEFLSIELLGPDHAPAWLAVMGVIFSVTSFATNDVFVFASRESGGVMEGGRLSGLRDFWVGQLLAFAHLALAGVLAVVGGYGALAATVFGAIDAVLLFQMWLVHLYLSDALRGPAPADPAEREAEADGT